jgi:hypothetical protein
MNKDLLAATLLASALVLSLLFALNSNTIKALLTARPAPPASPNLPANLSLSINQPIQDQIQNLLPQGSFLREVELVPRSNPKQYLFLYLDPGYRIHDWDYSSCPGGILSQALAGSYRLGLFQENKIVSQIVLPPAYTDPSNTISQSLELAYQTQNQSPSDASPSAVTPQVAKLLNFADYTGDGRQYEVLFTTTNGGCGFYDGLVAGIDTTQKKLNLYSNWIPRFNPDNKGIFNYLFDCGDHGNTTKVQKQYRYNPAKKYFEVVAQTETPCQ